MVFIAPILKRLEWEIWDLDGECFYVGYWTGPDGDLIAVRRASTSSGAANYWLSPPGNTLLGALLRALILRFTGLRISAWSDTARRPMGVGAWFSTTDWSGHPRRNTWWGSRRAEAWIREWDRKRLERVR
jgi:hypothetical protein